MNENENVDIFFYDSEREYCEKCGEFKEINGVSGYCDDCRPKNR